MGNVGIYSVGTESVYQIAPFGKTICFVGVSQEGLTREILAKHNCLDYTDSSHSSHVQGTCFTSRDALSRDTRENSSSFNCLSLHTLSLSLSLSL